MRTVTQDMLKMIPFSAFLIIPGAELLLPVYLNIFPNAMPSQFVSGDDLKLQFSSRHSKQEEAAIKLGKIWPVYLAKL